MTWISLQVEKKAEKPRPLWNHDLLFCYCNQINEQLIFMHEGMTLTFSCFIKMLNTSFEYCGTMDFHRRQHICLLLERLLMRNHSQICHYNIEHFYNEYQSKKCNRRLYLAIRVNLLLCIFEIPPYTWLDWLLIPADHFIYTMRGVLTKIQFAEEINCLNRYSKQNDYALIL